MQLARGGDSDAVRLADDYDWYLMPVLNPDGYSFTFTDVSSSTLDTLMRCSDPLRRLWH